MDFLPKNLIYQDIHTYLILNLAGDKKKEFKSFKKELTIN